MRIHIGGRDDVAAVLELWAAGRSAAATTRDDEKVIERRLRGSGARRVTALVGSEDRIAQSLWRAVGYEHDPYVARFVRNL